MTSRLASSNGMPAGHQVEQVLVLQPAARAGVPGAGHLAGQDLQVRHRVDPGAVGQHEVAVVLVGVGAGGLGPDDHVADPHRVRVRRPAARPCSSPGSGSSARRGPRTAGAPGAGPHRRSTARAARRPRQAPRTAPTAPAARPRRRASPPCAISRASLPELRVVMRQMHRIIRPRLQRHHSRAMPRPRPRTRRCPHRSHCPVYSSTTTAPRVRAHVDQPCARTPPRPRSPRGPLIQRRRDARQGPPAR